MASVVILITPDIREVSGWDRACVPLSWATYLEPLKHPLLTPLPDPKHAEYYAQEADAIVFSGGHDLDSTLWGEERHPQLELSDPRRALFEFALLEAAWKHQTPVLAVCLGIQTVNVWRGGTLIQHLPPEAYDRHIKDPSLPFVEHGVHLEPSPFWEESSVQVPSQHHQALKKLGNGLRVIARSQDEIIEAIEAKDHSQFLGVQWHPERQPHTRLSKNILEIIEKWTQSPLP